MSMNPIKLSQVTTVCFDKDKALCDGSLIVKKLVILDSSKTESEISQIISNVLNAVDQHSLFISVLKQKYDFKQSGDVKKVLPYDINKGTFGAVFTNNKTYVIGAIEDMLLVNKAGIIRRSEEFINQGHDVYVLGQTNSGAFDKELDAVALIIVKENIRQSMTSSIKWLNENNVNVVVVSSDNSSKTSSIAYEAGVKNINNETVFSNLSQEQKNEIIRSLKAKGEKVLFVDDDFGDLSKAFKTSKRLVNSLSNSCLFIISKLLLAVLLVPLLTIGYNVKAFDNPFGLFRYFALDAIIDAFVITLLMLNKSDETIKGRFITNIFKKALPGAITMFASAFVAFTLYSMQRNGHFSFGLYNVQIAITMSVISFAVLGTVTLYNILSPLNKHHRFAMVATVSITAILLAVSAIVSYTTNRADLFFGISFMEMNGPAYLLTAIITILLAGLYITIYRIVDAFKGKDE